MFDYIIRSRVGLKRKGIFALAIFIFLLFLVGASDISVFEVDLIADETPTPVISINVQEEVYFGQIRKGEQTDNVRINITNTGNVPIIITPRLASNSEVFFNYTYFQRRTADPYFKIGSFNFNLSASSVKGGNKTDYFYSKLDLRNYSGEIPVNVTGYSTNVKFFAVAQ